MILEYGKQCASTNTWLGYQDSVAACATAVAGAGGTYFNYGRFGTSRERQCNQEATSAHSCASITNLRASLVALAHSQGRTLHSIPLSSQRPTTAPKA